MQGSSCPVELMKRVMTELHMPEVTICYGVWPLTLSISFGLPRSI
jgi:hypothetical protein